MSVLGVGGRRRPFLVYLSEMSGNALTGLALALVGAGRVGTSLARWASAAGARTTAIGFRPASRGPTATAERPDPPPAVELARRLGCPAVPLDELTTASADLLLIAVSDPALGAVAELLAGRRQAAVALHTSGSRGGEALAPLAATGCAVGSLHPLKAFPQPLPDPAAARGTTFGIGGDAAATKLARRLIAAWDAEAVEIPDSARLLYHFAATLAAGGTVTLVAAAAELARRLGLPSQVAAGYLELARGALAAVDPAAVDPAALAAAITGPVSRGDAETVGAQLAALGETAPQLQRLAGELARQTLHLLAAEDTSGEDDALARRRQALAESLDRSLPTPSGDLSGDG